ncbi:MAG: hypothetical protein D3M94_17535 [Rhodocyclales bacterium GT-UBC]|nr:MAG: hypothetical protein D3M94_17535 [Rhodocyclales bacterium GT-UBC]
MHPSTLALLIAAAIAAGCTSNQAKKEEAPPVATTAAEPAAPPPKAKPECQPDPSSKTSATKTSSKKKPAAKKGSKKAEETPPPDCEPAAPKVAPSSKATEASPPPPPPSTAKETGSSGKACNPCVVKSRDGTFEGEVYGNPPANSKWAKLQIGMEQPEVERILGGTSNDVRTMPTGKAFIPFYYGTDRYRYEVVYHGQGSVSYTGGSWGGGRGVLMMINYDPKM